MGPHADSAAFRWAQLNLVGQIWENVTTTAQSILMGGVATDDLNIIDAEFVDIADLERIKAIKILMDTSGINKNMASTLIDIYDSLEDLSVTPLKQVASIVYTKTGKSIGEIIAKKILTSVRAYLKN